MSLFVKKKKDYNIFCLCIHSPDMKSLLIRKDPDAGKDWRQEEKEMTEDKIVGWHPDSMDMSLSKLWEIGKDR